VSLDEYQFKRIKTNGLPHKSEVPIGVFNNNGRETRTINRVITMAEEFVIKLMSDDFSAGVSSSGATKSSGAGGVGAFAGLTAVLGGIGFAIQQIMDVVMPVINDLLKPIKAIVQGIFRSLGEFLRPIVEIAVMLLRPVLAILKPIISIFKSFMAPFMAIARQFSNLATAKFAAGDIGGGMSDLMDAIRAIVYPFVVTITSISLQMLMSLLIQGVSSIISALLDSLGNMLSQSSIGFIRDIGEGLLGASNSIRTWGQETTSTVNGWITDATVAILDTMQKEYEQKLEDAQAISDAGWVKVVDPISQAVAASEETMKLAYGTDGTIPMAMSNGLDNMGISLDNSMNSNSQSSIPGKFETGLTYMEDSTSVFVEYMRKKGEELVDEAKKYASKIKSDAKKSIEFNLIKIGG